MATLVSPGVSTRIWDISTWVPSYMHYYVTDEAEVDGNIWYSIRLINVVYDWVLKQDPDLWVVTEQGFDIHEELFFIMKLIFPE